MNSPHRIPNAVPKISTEPKVRSSGKGSSKSQTINMQGEMFKLIAKGAAAGVYVSANNIVRRICPPLKPLGFIVNSDGSNPAMRLKFRNRFEQICTVHIAVDIVYSPKKLLKTLVENGLDIECELTYLGATAINMYLRAKVPTKTWLRVQGEGWMLLPDRTYGYALGSNLYCGAKRFEMAPALAVVAQPKQGTVNTWLDITKQIRYDAAAVMMMCAGFASALLFPLKRDATFVVLTGRSGIGKTTILKLVSALFATPSSMVTWEATENGIEAATKRYQHQPFVIDEIGQGSAQVFAKAAYRLTNGAGKLRADSAGALVENKRNFSVVLSAGEQSPIDMMLAAGLDVKAGQRARLLCVSVSEKDGVWSTVEGYSSGAEKSKQITAALNECHGVAGEVFCEFIARDPSQLDADYAAAAAKLRKQIAANMTTTTGDGVVDRVLENFVLFAFAGILAVKAEAVAWTREHVVAAMQRTFALWRAEHEKSRTVTDEEIMNRLRLFFQSERCTKFKPFDQYGDEHAGVLAGYEQTPRGGGEPVFLVYPAFFEYKICGDLDKNAVIAQLRSRNLLVPGSRNGPTKQFHLPGVNNRSVSFYVIKQSILLT